MNFWYKQSWLSQINTWTHTTYDETSRLIHLKLVPAPSTASFNPSCSLIAPRCVSFQLKLSVVVFLLHWGELPMHHLWETVSFSTLSSTLRGAILKNAIMALMAVLKGRGRSEPGNWTKVVSLFTYPTTETYTLSANGCWQQLTHGCLWNELRETCVRIAWQLKAMMAVMAH